MDHADSHSSDARIRKTADAPNSAKAEGPRTAVLLALCVLAIAYCATLFNARSGTNAVPEAPPLPRLSARCEVVGEGAAPRAHAAEQAARAKMARYPYDPADGLRALLRLAEAKRCFANAGDESDTARVDRLERRWRNRIEGDYRDHLTRYRRAVLTADDGPLRLEVDVLLALLADQHGIFVDRLRSTQLALAASDDRAEAR